MLDVARDALDDDDRVVHDDADRKYEREQRWEIDRKTQRGHRGERADDRDRHRGRRHQHGPPILQEDHNNDEHQNEGLEQRPVDFADRGPDEFRRVVGRDVCEALREALGELVHFRLDLLGDRDCVGARQEGDANPGARPAIVIKRFAVGLGAELGVADVADSGDASAVGGIDLDDDVLELARDRQGGP